jgi:hypothetical protein
MRGSVSLAGLESQCFYEYRRYNLSHISGYISGYILTYHHCVIIREVVSRDLQVQRSRPFSYSTGDVVV